MADQESLDRNWAFALREVESSDRQAGLWARCFATCGGDENAAKAAYIRERAGQLDQEDALGTKSSEAGRFDVPDREPVSGHPADLPQEQVAALPTPATQLNHRIVIAVLVVAVCLLGLFTLSKSGDHTNAPVTQTLLTNTKPAPVPGPAPAPAPAVQPHAGGASAASTPRSDIFDNAISVAIESVGEEAMLRQVSTKAWRECARDIVTRRRQGFGFGSVRSQETEFPPSIKELGSTVTPLGVRYELIWIQPRKESEALRSRWSCEVSREGDVIELSVR